MSSISFDGVRVLSFDIYGTLVDWETGIVDALADSPLQPHLPPSRQKQLEDFEELEGQVQARHPELLEHQILAEVLRQYATRLGVNIDSVEMERGAVAFGNSIGAWPAFPDSVVAMQQLAKKFKLVPLSNIDEESFRLTMAGPLRGVAFDAVYTAQAIGSYKPDIRNFNYMLQHIEQDFGAAPHEVVHIACSLYHDIAPATKAGMTSVFVNRQGHIGSKLGPRLDPDDPDSARKIYGFQKEVSSLAEVVELVK